jgi:hypothetical protein
MDPDPQKMNVIAMYLTPEAICEYVSVADPGSLSRIRDPNFSIPDQESKRFRIPDPDPHKEFKYYSPITVSKLSEKLSGLFIPDLGSGFFPI